MVDILQPCVSFNHVNTYEWYSKRVYKIDTSYNRFDKLAAFARSQEWDDHIPIGVVYQQDKASYEEEIINSRGNNMESAQIMAGDIANLIQEFT
jgi:2-oxoglutarate ferredoxin oxidoreductase subunit beta